MLYCPSRPFLNLLRPSHISTMRDGIDEVERLFVGQVVGLRCTAALFCPKRRFVKGRLFAAHISYLRFEIFSDCTSKSSAVLCGEDFGIFSLDIHATLFKKKAENGGI